MKLIKNIFKWNPDEVVKAMIGTVLFAIGINLFIVPMGLYNGGVLGASQLIRTGIIKIFNIKSSFDFSGIINFLINVPLFILAYKKISKTFFARTLFCVAIQTICLSIIPIPTTPIVSEILTSVLIGGIIAGFGGGMTLSAGASGGGTDIVGVALSMKNRNLSVGKLGLSFNVVIYTICGITTGLSTMIYSIIYSAIATLVVDNRHAQNICSTAIIFTKNNPERIIEYVKNELKRDGTYWEAIGGYDKSVTYICYVVLSKYELQKLERNLETIDNHAFIVKSNGVTIKGEFKKNL